MVPCGDEIPLAGATGRLLAALGRAGSRPCRLHVKVSHPNGVPLTTQIYFDHDPMIDSDRAL